MSPLSMDDERPGVFQPSTITSFLFLKPPSIIPIKPSKSSNRMGKTSKIFGTAHCKFVEIKLKKSYPSKFRITFVRGKKMSRSDLVSLNKDNVLVFNTPFKVGCHFFVKNDKVTRKKQLKVVLHRFISPEESRIYGEAIIDLGNYFFDEEEKTTLYEMGSQHSSKPILTFSCKVHVNHRKNKSSLLDSASFEEIYYNESSEENVPVKKPQKKKLIKNDDSSSLESLENPKEEVKKDEVPPAPNENSYSDYEEEEEEEEEAQIDSSNAMPQIKRLVSGMNSINLSKLKELEINATNIFKNILNRNLPEPVENSYMDAEIRSVPFPPAVYPIYQTMLKSKMFTNAYDDEQFTEAFDTFMMLYPNAPLCAPCNTEQRFLTTLVLLLITNLHSAQYGYLLERTSVFFTENIKLLNQYAREIVSPLIDRFEDVVTLFSTARFDVDNLLNDFSVIYDETIEKFQFLPSINRYLTNCLNNSLDANMINRILQNPARFAFSKAVTWNSFLTAAMTTKQLDFPLTRQCVTCLLMAVNIVTDQAKEGEEDMKTSICPDLKPEILVYLLKNYKADNMMQMTINYRLFAQKLKVDDVVRPEPLQPQEQNDFQLAGDSIRVQLWNQIIPNPELVKEFPFMATK